MSQAPLRFALLKVLTRREYEEKAIQEMQELEALVHTFGGVVVERSTQHRPTPHAGTYIGGGKVEWLSRVVEEQKIDVVVLNDIVKPGQLFRLEQSLWPVNRLIKVWDRIGMILAIFELHAKTTEAKLQIELARIKHIGPRIYGLGGTVLSKQGGGIGTRGAGETNSEIERRHIKRRTLQIETELAHRSKMAQSRINDRRRQGVRTVALVGYTSAGKTTLFNLLTGKAKEENAGLFTTLDSVLGKLKLPSITSDILISDTIGFIEDLPPLLINAFRSTLQESIQADVLLHVINCSDPQYEEKIETVRSILHDLPAIQHPILVFNQIDKISESAQQELRMAFMGQKHVLVSAKTGEGIDELKRLIAEAL